MLSRRALLLLFLAFTALWFGTLDYRKLIKPDEGRYAEIAREMAVGGDWITPRLNGLKYFEKPPLQYWATTAAFKAFGEHEWTARLWPAVTGFFSVLLVFFTGRRLFGEPAGLFGALIAASSFALVGMGHLNTLDMGLAFFLQLAVSGFLLAQQPGAAARRWMLLAWLALAFAMLSKGLVALVLTGGTLVLYSLACRDFAPWRRLELARGLPLFLLVAAPWFVAVSLANPEFFHFFFIHEHFERFLTKSHRRYEPWWFFVPLLLAGALPWTFMLPQSLAAAWRRRAPGFHAGRFLAIWIGVVFVFFSLSDSKLPSYILPLFPALALLTGRWLQDAGRRALTIHLGVIVLLAAALLLFLPTIKEIRGAGAPMSLEADYLHWIEASAAIWLAGSAAALVLVRRSGRELALAVCAVAAFVAESGILLGHETLSRAQSAYHIARQIKPLVAAEAPFYSVAAYDQTLPFYLQRTLTLVQYRDEFSLGLEQEPAKGIPTLDEFMSRWNADPTAFAFMLPDTYELLRGRGLPMAVVARDRHRIVVRKP